MEVDGIGIIAKLLGCTLSVICLCTLSYVFGKINFEQRIQKMKDKNKFVDVIANALKIVIGIMLISIMIYVLYFVLPSTSEVGKEIFKPLDEYIKLEAPQTGAPWNSLDKH